MKIDADTKQRLKSAVTLMAQLYRVVTGCFLTVFVPHSCGDTMCSFSHNLTSTDSLHQIALLFNVFCFLCFLFLYFAEASREAFAIEYLDIEPSKPNDNLDEAIERYPKLKSRMFALNSRYSRAVSICTVAHTANLGASFIDIWFAWPGSPALAPLISYSMLINTKLIGARTVAKESLTSERMYSAYLTTPRTYNAIDKDHRLPDMVVDAEAGKEKEDKEQEEEEAPEEVKAVKQEEEEEKEASEEHIEIEMSDTRV